MSRIAIRFERFSKEPCTFRLVQTPVYGQEPTEVKPFSLKPSDVDGTPRDAGDKLFVSLQDNTDVGDALDFVFGQQVLVPVHMEVAKGAESTDVLPWEYLFSRSQRFLALSKFWPIARSLHSAGLPNVTFRELTVVAGRPQIRVLAVLGAGDDWEWEWKSFRALAQKAQDLGCDFRLRLLVGHSEAWKRINREAGAAIASAFTNLDELWALLRDEKFCPNIIHFLCHGTAGKDPVMHCATILDHQTHSQQRLDIVTPGEILRRLPKNQFLWMIVLNCCELAEATAESQQSFARGLVGNEAPVVIAHRAPIEVTDAATVTCGLYESIFAKAAAASGESAQEVEWADVLAIARDKLLNNHRKGTGPQTEENTVQWSLPVVYVTSPGFVMRTNHGDPDPVGSAWAATTVAMQNELLDVDQLPDEYRRNIENVDSASSGITLPAEAEASSFTQPEATASQRVEDEEEGFAAC